MCLTVNNNNWYYQRIVLLMLKISWIWFYIIIERLDSCADFLFTITLMNEDKNFWFQNCCYNIIQLVPNVYQLINSMSCKNNILIESNEIGQRRRPYI